MLKTLIAPAAGLMSRLRFPHKFMLLGLVAIVSISFLQAMLWYHQQSVVAPARHELKGIAVLKPLLAMVKGVQQHRGLASQVLNGNATMSGRLAEVGENTNQQMALVNKALADAGMSQNSDWQTVKARWQTLLTAANMTPAESFAAHTDVVAQLQTFQVLVADETELTLDPQLDSYYLMDTAVSRLPRMLELLAQMRGKGAGILAKKEFSGTQQEELGALEGELQGAKALVDANLHKATRYTPAFGMTLDAPLTALMTAVNGATSVVKEDVLSGQFSTPSDAYFDRLTKVIDAGNQLMSDQLLPILEESLNERVKRDVRFSLLVSAISLALVLVLIYLALGAYQSIVSAVNRVDRGATQIAAGDLTTRIQVGGRDELYDIAQAFNRVAASVAEAMSKVKNGADQVSNAAQSLSTATTGMVQTMDGQSSATKYMAASVEEMAVSMEQIAANAADVRMASEDAGQRSVEGKSIVEKTSTEISQVAEAVQQSASTVQVLGQQSAGISDIVNVIREIADQTNLLALNAAIEAARAGESGRGFAVVADEVRKLAERTSLSTNEITQKIDAIQAGTANAVASMKSGVSRVMDGVAMAREAGDSIGSINDQTQHVIAAVNDISLALSEQTAVTQEITRNIEGVASMVESSHHALQGLAHTANDMEKLAQELQTEVARFRV